MARSAVRQQLRAMSCGHGYPHPTMAGRNRYGDSMSGQHESDDSEGTVAIREPGLLAQFASMATLIPAADDGGAERILAQILSAERWDQLDSPWESAKVAELAGRRFELRHAERMPSDFRDGLGMFLVLHCTDIKTGESVAVTSGSVSVLGQVARAYMLDALPLIIEFIVADRPTRSGYYPHHLKIHASMAGKAAGNGESAPA